MLGSINNSARRLRLGSTSILKKTLAIWILTAAYPALFYFLLGLMEAIGNSNISFTDALMAGGLLALIMFGYIALVWGPVNSIFLYILRILNICSIQYEKKWVLYAEPVFFLLFVLIYDRTLYFYIDNYLLHHFSGIFNYNPTYYIYTDTFLSTVIKWCLPVIFTGFSLWIIQFLYRRQKNDNKHN